MAEALAPVAVLPVDSRTAALAAWLRKRGGAILVFAALFLVWEFAVRLFGIKHIRAITPLPQPTGWHWHDMDAHFVYVLKGWLTFRFAGVDGDVRVDAGSGLSQPAGVAHNVVARSDDLEVLEINVPAHYGTFDLAEPPEGAHG